MKSIKKLENKVFKNYRFLFNYCIILTGLVLISFCNPHFINGTQSKSVLVYIDNIDYYYTDEPFTHLYKAIYDTVEINCFGAVSVYDNHLDLCHNSNRAIYCPTRQVWEIKGDGICSIEYEKQTKILKWF